MDNLIDIFSENYGLEWKSASELIKRMGKVSFRKSEIVVNNGVLDDPLYILESGIWSGAKSPSAERLSWTSSATMPNVHPKRKVQASGTER